MSTLMVSAEGASVRRRGSGKPRLIVRGARRKHCSEVLRKLGTLQNQDDGENRRSAIHDYNPYLIFGSQNSKARKALADLLKALQDALSAKA